MHVLFCLFAKCGGLQAGSAAFLAAAAPPPVRTQSELMYIWERCTPEGKGVIFILMIFSIFAWSVMVAKTLQMRRAKKLNRYFEAEFRTQPNVLGLYDRRISVPECPLFVV